MIELQVITIDKIPHHLVEDALQDVAIKEHIYPHNIKMDRVLILYQGTAVGFFIPRIMPDNFYRALCIYISPHFRCRGFATEAIRIFTHEKKSWALINEDNVGSQRAFEKAGFVITNKIRKMRLGKYARIWCKFI